jgi:hypothetical protein
MLQVLVIMLCLLKAKGSIKYYWQGSNLRWVGKNLSSLCVGGGFCW